MNNNQLLTLLETEEIFNSEQMIIGLVKRWGQPHGFGNSIYTYEPFDDRPDGVTTSKNAAVTFLLGQQSDMKITSRIVKSVKVNNGSIEQVLHISSRRRTWRWITKDERLSGEATSYGEALEALQQTTE